MYWYDLWDSDEGQMAYIQTNIHPDEMKKLESEFVRLFPVAEMELWREDAPNLLNTFFKWLREDCQAEVNIVNRPENSIEIVRRYDL